MITDNNMPKLTGVELLEKIMPLGAAVGERYPATGMALIYR